MGRYLKTDSDWAALYDTGNRLVGELTSVWDDVDWFAFLIFVSILRIDQTVAWPLYYSHQNLRARLEMIENAADVALYDRPVLLKQVHSLMKRVGKFAIKRNNIMHAVWHRIESQPAGRELIRVTRLSEPGSDMKLAIGINISQKDEEDHRYDFKKISRVIADTTKLADDLQEFWHAMLEIEKLSKLHHAVAVQASNKSNQS